MKKGFFTYALLAAFVPVLAAGAAARAQSKPDLVVAKAAITPDAQGLFIDKIAVVVTNGCRAAAAASNVLITFKTSSAPDAKAIYFIGKAVKALKGGESYSQTFEISDKKIGVGRYVLVEADPYKKVAEASEDNNWRTLFPDAAGAPLTPTQCSQQK